MNARRLITSLLVVGAGYGTFVLIRQVMLLKKSCVKFVNYRFEKLSLTYARLVVVLQVQNKSDIDFKLKAQKMDVYLNNQYVSSVKSKMDISLPAQTPQNISLAIEFDPRNVVKGALSSLLNSASNTLVTVKGKLTVISSAIVVNNINVNESITLAEILAPSNSTNNC